MRVEQFTLCFFVSNVCQDNYSRYLYIVHESIYALGDGAETE